MSGSPRRADAVGPVVGIVGGSRSDFPILEAAVARGESDRTQANKLVSLAADYGGELLERAVADALSRGTPNAASVTFLLQKLVRSLKKTPALKVAIPSRPELVDLALSPRHARSYDALHSGKVRRDDE